MDEIRSVRYFLRYFHAIIFEGLDEKFPDWGANYDWKHTVYLGDVDIFVTDDVNFCKLLKLIAPVKEIFNLQEFLNIYCS